MPGRYCLGNRRHPNGIGSKQSIHAYLSRRFITWSCEGCVNTAAGGDSQPPRLFNYQFLQISRINFRHVREAQTESRIVGTHQRVPPGEIDVIGNQHQRARPEISVHAAGGIGDDQRLCAEAAHGLSVQL